MGGTEVLCAASVEARVPPFLRNSGQGWVTAEYGMLPRATHTRGDRTRCAGITGAWVALHLAIGHLIRMNVLKVSPLTGQVAAVSCGLVDGRAVLDLDYAEDSGAEADANFVLTDAGGIVEIQATAEKTSFAEAQFSELLSLAKAGTARLFELQRQAVAGT
jgi:ribonuclease PH